MKYREELFKDYNEFLKYLLIEKGGADSRWIFRGHADASYRLEPTIIRNNNYLNSLPLMQHRLIGIDEPGHDIGINFHHEFERINHVLGENAIHEDTINRTIEIIKLNFVEAQLIEDFLYAANDSAHYVPSLSALDINHHQNAAEYVWQNHPNRIREFLQIKKGFAMAPHLKLWLLNNYIQCFEYESHALARHHDVTTRLIDWTYNPLVSAFFASLQDSFKSSVDIAVWCLNGHDQRWPDIGIDFHPVLKKHHLKYLSVQQGLFTEMRAFDGYMLKYGEWPTLDGYLKRYIDERDEQDIQVSDILEKITLSHDEVPKLKIYLEKHGYAIHHLMPTYDNVGRFVMSRYR